jgi:hypothetical protein
MIVEPFRWWDALGAMWSNGDADLQDPSVRNSPRGCDPSSSTCKCFAAGATHERIPCQKNFIIKAGPDSFTAFFKKFRTAKHHLLPQFRYFNLFFSCETGKALGAVQNIAVLPVALL